MLYNQNLLPSAFGFMTNKMVHENKEKPGVNTREKILMLFQHHLYVKHMVIKKCLFQCNKSMVYYNIRTCLIAFANATI